MKFYINFIKIKKHRELSPLIAFVILTHKRQKQVVPGTSWLVRLLGIEEIQVQ